MASINQEQVPQKTDGNIQVDQRQNHSLHPRHAHNRGSDQCEQAYDKYKEEYTLLPSQKMFKVVKMNAYERDEEIKQMALEKELEIRHEHRLINSQDEEKRKETTVSEANIEEI